MFRFQEFTKGLDDIGEGGLRHFSDFHENGLHAASKKSDALLH